MSAETLEKLRKDFHPRQGLRAEEVALLLRGRNSRGAVQKVREGMKTGRYPNAKKVDGLWQMPLEDVAEILEPTPTASPTLPSANSKKAPSKSGRRKSPIGPWLVFVHSTNFWADVCRALGYLEDAKNLEDHLKEMQLARDIKRTEKQAAGLKAQQKGFGAPAPPKGRGGL